jgi:hypothetical protein
MGTAIVTLLLTVPDTRVIERVSWVTSNSSIQPSPAPRCYSCSCLAARAEFPASRGVLLLRRPEQAGATR